MSAVAAAPPGTPLRRAVYRVGLALIEWARGESAPVDRATAMRRHEVLHAIEADRRAALRRHHL